jgi:hypothetical protein
MANQPNLTQPSNPQPLNIPGNILNTPGQKASQPVTSFVLSLHFPGTATDLETWTVEALNEKIAAKAEFTALDVTRDIRNAHPGADVPHSKVKPIVYSYMSDAIAEAVYDVQLRSYTDTDGDPVQANTFFPL